MPRAKTSGIPGDAQAALRQRLDAHAAGRCREVVLRFRGSHAYVDAIDAEGEAIKLLRLTWLGSAERWRWAFFKYSDNRYEPSVGMSGSFVVTAEEAFDCAAMVYLA